MSTRAISTAISKEKHIWRKCMSPGRYINRYQQSEFMYLRCILTAFGNVGKGILDCTAVSTSTVCQPQSEKREHIRRSCISSARCSCISTAIKIESQSTAGRQSHFDMGGVSTANSKAEKSSAAVYHHRGMLYINSHQNRERKHFWTTQSFRPGWCINHDQQSELISAAAVCHQRGIAVYQQQ